MGTMFTERWGCINCPAKCIINNRSDKQFCLVDCPKRKSGVGSGDRWMVTSKISVVTQMWAGGGGRGGRGGGGQEDQSQHPWIRVTYHLSVIAEPDFFKKSKKSKKINKKVSNQPRLVRSWWADSKTGLSFLISASMSISIAHIQTNKQTNKQTDKLSHLYI